MKKMVFVYLGRKGGASIYSYEMAKAMIENGLDLYIFVSSFVDNIEDWKKLKCKNLELIKTYKTRFGFLFSSLIFKFKKHKLKKKYKNIDIDICYSPMQHFWTKGIFSIFHCENKIYTIHDPIYHSTNKKVYWKFIEIFSGSNRINKEITDYVVLSKKFIEIVSEKYKINRSKVHYIPHGIFDFYKEKSNGVIYNYNINNAANFLFFGRIDAYKGIDTLLDAYAEVVKIIPKSSLIIAGSGDFSLYLEKSKNIENVIVINKWIANEEVSSFFQSNANVILICPYKDATQSGVIPIAFSNGVPVIASNTGGLTEQINDNVTGFIFNNTVESLVEKMVFVANRDNNDIILNEKIACENLKWNNLAKKLITEIESGK